MKASDFLTRTEKSVILKAIVDAEKNTSGEIRVHIEKSHKGEILDRAAFIFAKLKMHKTALRNGVLFYLDVEAKKFAVLGDIEINKAVPEDFWNSIKEAMISFFLEGKFSEGLVKGIGMTGDKLKIYFPFQQNDVNELSDEISFSN